MDQFCEQFTYKTILLIMFLVVAYVVIPHLIKNRLENLSYKCSKQNHAVLEELLDLKHMVLISSQ